MQKQNQQDHDASCEIVAVGWRAIGAASGNNAQTLAVRNSYGTLPVTPIKLPNGRVAMTQEQVGILRRCQMRTLEQLEASKEIQRTSKN